MTDNKKATEKKIIKVWLCDICSSDWDHEPVRMYVDTPYLPHIHKKVLCKVCPPCLKLVQEFNPRAEIEDRSWFT